MTRVNHKDATEQELLAKYETIKARITALEHIEASFVDKTQEKADLEQSILDLKSKHKEENKKLKDKEGKIVNSIVEKEFASSELTRTFNILKGEIEEFKKNAENEQTKEEEIRKLAISKLDSEIERKNKEIDRLGGVLKSKNDEILASDTKIAETALKVDLQRETLVEANQKILEIENRTKVLEKQEKDVEDRVVGKIETEKKLEKKLEEKGLMIQAKEEVLEKLKQELKKANTESLEAREKLENLRSQILGLVMREEKLNNDIIPKLRVILEKAGSNIQI